MATRRFQIRKEELYFGVSLLLIAWFGNRALHMLNGYYYLDVPDPAKGRIFVKRFDDGNQMRAFYENNGISYGLYDAKGNPIMTGVVTDAGYVDRLTYRYDRKKKSLEFLFKTVNPVLDNPNRWMDGKLELEK